MMFVSPSVLIADENDVDVRSETYTLRILFIRNIPRRRRSRTTTMTRFTRERRLRIENCTATVTSSRRRRRRRESRRYVLSRRNDAVLDALKTKRTRTRALEIV